MLSELSETEGNSTLPRLRGSAHVTEASLPVFWVSESGDNGEGGGLATPSLSLQIQMIF